MLFENGLNLGNVDLVKLLNDTRWVLIKLLIATVGTGAIIYIFADKVLIYLQIPLGKPTVFYGVTEAFFAELKIGFYGGLFVSIPYLFWQIWSVITPLLDKSRTKASKLVSWMSSILFYMGAALCYFIVLPSGMKFLIGYEREGLKAMISVGRYLSLSVGLIFAFGFIFQLPLIMLFLNRLGIVNVAFLNHYRRYAVLVIAVISAILTPTPDAYNMILMGGPLWILYEVSVVLIWLFGKKKVESSDPDLL